MIKERAGAFSQPRLNERQVQSTEKAKKAKEGMTRTRKERKRSEDGRIGEERMKRREEKDGLERSRRFWGGKGQGGIEEVLTGTRWY